MEKNRRELRLEERGAIHLLNRAAKYLVKVYYTHLGKRFDGCLAGAWDIASAEDAKRIIDSCSAAVFHGGEPQRGKKAHWSQEIEAEAPRSGVPRETTDVSRGKRAFKGE